MNDVNNMASEAGPKNGCGWGKIVCKKIVAKATVVLFHTNTDPHQASYENSDSKISDRPGLRVCLHVGVLKGAHTMNSFKSIILK